MDIYIEVLQNFKFFIFLIKFHFLKSDPNFFSIGFQFYVELSNTRKTRNIFDQYYADICDIW